MNRVLLFIPRRTLISYVNNAAASIHARVYVDVHVHFSGQIPGRGIAGSRANRVFNLLGKHQTGFHGGSTILHPTPGSGRVCFLPALSHTRCL